MKQYRYMLETLAYLISLTKEKQMSADNQQATVGWLAGIFDTDGCFGVRLGHRQTLTPFASVTNTNPLIIEAVADLLSSVGRHVSWKSNGTNAKPLGTVQVVGMQRLMKLFATCDPVLKSPQYDILKDYVARRFSLPRKHPYETVDYEMRTALQKKPFLEPQRLHAILSTYNRSFLAGWIAGVLDGDGAIMLKTGCLHSNGNTAVRPDIVVIGSEKITMDAVKWVAGCFGSDFTVVQKRQWNGHKIFHAQTGSERRTFPLLQAVTPYLKGKKQQAELVLEFCRYRDTVPHRTPHGEYEHMLQTSVMKLNARGDEDIV